MFKKIRKKFREIKKLLTENIPYIEEIEANQCFQCTNEIFKKTYEELKNRGKEQNIIDQIECYFEDGVDEPTKEIVFDLIMNYIHKYQSLPMYAMDFIFPDLTGDGTTVATINYVFPPDYSVDRIVFSIDIEMGYRD